MNVNLIASIAGFCTTISFFPQVIQVVRTKSTKDISLLMFAIFSIGLLFWIVYGFLTKSFPIIIANSIVFVLSTIIISYKIRYK